MEKKREITEEQVKEYQMLLAQWMQLPKDALEILNEDMPWRIREWLYVCALDQISGAELQAMKPQGLKKIQDIRAQFLKQKFQNLKEIQTQLNALQKQMEEGKEKQATVLSRLQEEVLQVLQYLEQEKQILKEREEQLLEEQRKYKEQFQQMEANRLEEEKSWSLWNRMWKKKQRKTQMCRKRAQMDQFVKQVLEEEKFSQEQKSYLLDCLEQGEEMEEVLYLAKSCLSVEQMERIKQLLSEHSQMFRCSWRKSWNKKKRDKEGSRDEDTGTPLPSRSESGNSLGVWNHYLGSATDISDTDFDMRKRSRNQGGVCQFSQKKAGRTMGGLGNRGGFTTKSDHRGSPGGDPDGNHKRFVSSQNRSLASAGVSTREEDSSCGRSNDPCPWGYCERNSVKTREIWGVLPYAAILQ